MFTSSGVPSRTRPDGARAGATTLGPGGAPETHPAATSAQIAKGALRYAERTVPLRTDPAPGFAGAGYAAQLMSTNAYLRALSYRFPTAESAIAETAHLRAVLELPRGAVHVVSDVHGENKKLEHILRNGSGSLRPLVDRVFAGRLDDAERRTLLNLVYYPRETWAERGERAPSGDAQRAFVREGLTRQCELLRVLAARYSLRHVMPYAREAARALDTLQAAAERRGRRRRRRPDVPAHGWAVHLNL